MVSLLDKSVGSVVTALREKHMLENSIILFMSDNGAKPEGIHANHGSNYPLRGVNIFDNSISSIIIMRLFRPKIHHGKELVEILLLFGVL